MRVLIMGPTGAVGAEAVRQCLNDPRVESVLALSRKPLKIEHDKLRVLLHEDFLNYSAIESEFDKIDVCFCALGISQTQERDPEKYTRITHDYPLAAARALNERNANSRFLFVSGMGVNPESKSRPLWARVKAQTETDLRALLGNRLTIFRPGYIYPVHPRERRFLLDAVSYPLYLLRALLPSLVTDTVEVAQAMLHCALTDDSPPLLNNREIRKAASSYQESWGRN